MSFPILRPLRSLPLAPLRAAPARGSARSPFSRIPGPSNASASLLSPRSLSTGRASLRGSLLSGGGRFTRCSAPRFAFTLPRERECSRGFASRFASTLSSTSTRSRLFKPTTIVLICVPIVCGVLGVWQVQRLKWKVALIDEVDRNLHKEPMVLPANINLDVLPEFSFRRVLLSGTPLPIPILLGPFLMDGVPGYSLILPFLRDPTSSTSGTPTPILLNRGFVPVPRAASIRAGSLPPGFVRRDDGSIAAEHLVVEGLLPRTGDRSYFTPENNLEGNEWFWRDVPAMLGYVRDTAEGLGVGEQVRALQGVMVDAIEQSQDHPAYLMQHDIPVGRTAHIELRNQHFQYAVIWFSLAAATSAMLGFVLTKGRRGPTARMDKRLRV